MESETVPANIETHHESKPTVRDITTADLREVFLKGLADFYAMPTHLPILCVIYPVLMFLTIRFYGSYDVLPFVFPLLAGFTLIGPLVAVGMYELSRRRETGADISRMHAFEVIRSPQIGSIMVLALILMAFYFAWLTCAGAIYYEFTGSTPPESVEAFVSHVLNTAQGRKLIYVGCSIGLVFSIVVLSISVTSFPMLLDRKINVITAIHTSVEVVYTNPVTMAVWGLVVASTLLIGALPFFLGLAIVMPVLGHATWHLYRLVVKY